LKIDHTSFTKAKAIEATKEMYNIYHHGLTQNDISEIDFASEGLWSVRRKKKTHFSNLCIRSNALD